MRWRFCKRNAGLPRKGESVVSSVAVIGATERNRWYRAFKQNLLAYGYDGALCPVNPNADTVEGDKAYPDLDAIDGEIDAVAVAVAAPRCPAAVRAAVARGVRDIAVVATGFAEVGSSRDGAALQSQLVEACAPDTRLYGPNGVGFADFTNRLCLIGQPIPYDNKPGHISIVSQSGALQAALMAGMIEDGGGVDWCVSLGNAPQFDIARAVDYIVSRGTSRVIAVYAETITADPQSLSAALQRAADAELAVVMLKAGRSALGKKIAYSHTASVAGDDAEIDAYLRAHGVIRVDSLEELARVSVLAPMRRRGRGSGVAVIGSSGGQAAVASELSVRDGLRLATLTDETMSLVKAKTSPGSFIDNPFDLTGGSGVDKGLFEAVYADSNVGFVLAPWNITFPDDTGLYAPNRMIMDVIISAALETGAPTVVSSLTTVPWTDWITDVRAANPEVAIVRGIETTIRALSRLFPADRSGDAEHADHAADDDHAALPGLIGEGGGREILARLDLPLVGGETCSGVEEAVEAAERLGWPVVMKLDVAGVAHRAKLGLVKVGCRDRPELESAITAALEALVAHGRDPRDLLGILVQRQASGVELLLGLHRSSLGAFVTIARGGIDAGVGTFSHTHLLPVTDEILADTISEVSGLAHESPGCQAAAAATASLCSHFQNGVLSQYSTVEINPALVSARGCAFVDVLMVTS
jgi:acetate---CoA ligase (ADP-forming)